MEAFNYEYSYKEVPTIKAFTNCDKRVRVIIGPVGSGKSSGCVIEMIARASEQKPMADGVRRSRWAVIRNCYDDKTEILTRDRGFKLFKDLEETDYIAVLIDGTIEYKKPDKVYCAPYDGEMVGFQGEGVDFLVTPDHKMYVSKAKTRKKIWDEYETKTAGEIYGSASYRVKRDGNWGGIDIGVSEDVFEWIGYWYAEGSIGDYWNTCKTKQYPRCVVTTTKDVEYARDLFKRANIDFSEWNRNPGINFVAKQSCPTFNKIAHLLIGKSHDKCIPMAIKNSTPSQLKAFIHGFLVGDGHVRKDSITKTLYTCSKQLADDLQEIALKAGIVANVAMRDKTGKPLMICGKEYKANYPEYTITLLSSKKYSPVLRTNKRVSKQVKGWYKENYSGNVYCVEMPLIPVYVRRNGKAFWCYRTMPELRSTTIKTVHDWLPPRFFGTYKETKREYLVTELPTADGSKIELEINYLALDDAADIQKLLSLELTGAWVNEVREIPKVLFDAIETRCGRFPAVKDGGSTWAGMICDTNPPDIDHWLAQLDKDLTAPDTEDKKLWPTKFEIFHQPSGLSPDAENIPYLEHDYYNQIAIGKDAGWIDVYVHGKYGYLRDGKPVYLNYSDAIHTSKNIIEPVKSCPLILGFDFGLNATCVMGQYLPNGRLNIIDEYVGEDIGIRRLIREVVKPILNTKYRGMELMITADPSGTKRSDTDEKSCYQELREHGLRVTHPASSNAWIPRFTAVDTFLTRTLGDGKPAFQVSPNCEIIRRGFISKYRRKKLGIMGSDMYREQAEKTIESHPHDCVQYIAMTCENTTKLLTRREQAARTTPTKKKPQMTAWL